ncbi:nucleotide sugar dehydrogenase [bacterium]|nr:nucleotide sugar dehydrogenase [bacterium]
MQNTTTFDNLIAKIKKHEALIGVIGLGYVGLPLAVEFGKVGFKVTGYDVSPQKVKLINSGISDILDVTSEDVKTLVDNGNLRAVDDHKALSEVDCVIVCVPTPLNKTKDPDVSYILDAFGKVRETLHRGQFIVLESTTYPGTTEELILPQLEESGLKVGVDFFLAFSPERVDPGNEKFYIKNTPKVVGGITANCTKAASAFYGEMNDKVVPVSTTKSAEMVKLLENTFRSVNIGLVNEVAMMCDKLGIDAWEIIDAASTKPFGFMPFYPGPGLGGHCIPIDPHYLSWKLKALNYYARFIELAGEINSNMPFYVVNKVTDFLNKNGKTITGAKILLLGIAYKANISDVRESPALGIMEILEEKGSIVSYTDPFVPVIKWKDGTRESEELTESLLANSDCVIVVTNHDDFDYKWIAEKSNLVFDTRNATKGIDSPRVKRLGAY